MNMDLNLLPSQAKFQAAKIKLKKRVNIFVWIFASLWASLVLVIFVMLFISQLNLKKAEKKYTSEQNIYKSMSSDAILSYQIKYQAKLVSKVLTDRFEYGSSIEKINNIFSSNISLENYKINNFKTFTMDGFVNDGKNMNEVESKIKEINEGEMEGLASAKLSMLTVNSKGWKFTMEVQLK